MIRELFDFAISLASGSGMDDAKRAIGVDFTKKRIRSISAFSSNAIFYFPVATTNQCTQEEYTMVSRMLERQYASFVVACISLIPFHKIRPDDEDSIEEYLSQFHQNMGFAKGKGDVASFLAKMDSITESAEVQNFFYQVWRESMLANHNPAIHIRDEYESLCESYGKHHVDKCLSILSVRQKAILDEMSLWGFLGTDAPKSIYASSSTMGAPLTNDYQEGNSFHRIDKRLNKYAGYLQESVEQVVKKHASDDVEVEYELERLDKELMFDTDDVDNTFSVCDLWFGNKYTEEPDDGMDDIDINMLQKIAYDIKSHIPHVKTSEIRYYPSDIRRCKLVISFEPEQSLSNNQTQQTKPEFNDLTPCDVSDFSRIKSLGKSEISEINSIDELQALKKLLSKYIKTYEENLSMYKREWRNAHQKFDAFSLLNYFLGRIYLNPRSYMNDYYSCIDIASDRIRMIDDRIREILHSNNVQSPSQISAKHNLAIENFKLLNDDIGVQDDIIGSDAFVLADGLNDVIIKEGAIYSDIDDESFYMLIDEAAAKISDVWDNIPDASSVKMSNIMKHYVKNPPNSSNTTSKGSIESEFIKGGRISAGGRKTRNRHIYRGDPDIEEGKDGLSRIERELRTKYGSKSGAVYYTGNDSNYTPDKDRSERERTSSGGHENGYTKKNIQSFSTVDSRAVFTQMDMSKANDALPTFAKCSVGFVVEGTDDVIMKDFLVGIKAYCHLIPSKELIDDLYQAIINRRKFLKFVKFITGEEKSLADLVFGIRELKTDALDNSIGSKKVSKWRSAIQRRKRWSDMAIPYITKEYTPNATIVITQNEVDFIKEHYGVDLLNFNHVRMLMEQNFLLGFVIIDQTNETVNVLYDGHGYNMQQYTYAQLERENNTSDRMMRELYRSFAK